LSERVKARDRAISHTNASGAIHLIFKPTHTLLHTHTTHTTQYFERSRRIFHNVESHEQECKILQNIGNSYTNLALDNLDDTSCAPSTVAASAASMF